MEIKVALIGPSDLLDEFLHIATAYPNLKLLPFGYTDVQETPSLVLQCLEQVDVLLFAGPIPYHIACEHVAIHKPTICVSYNGTSLYRVFFQFVRENKYNYKDNRLRFSIDILRKEEIEERLEELDIAFEEMFVMENPSNQKTDAILQFHQDLWMNRKVDTVFTCSGSVYKHLVKAGVSCYFIKPTKTAIHNALYRVQIEGKSMQLSDTQIAIGIIGMESFSQGRGTLGYGTQRKKLALQQLLIDYGEEIQAVINWSDLNEITFVTTRGVIERTTNNFSQSPLLEQIINRLHLSASIGIGLGRTVNEAQNKAGEALLKAKSGGGKRCFIAFEDGNVIGPLGEEHQLAYSLRSDDPDRLLLAKNTGLSIGTINKLIAFCHNHGSSRVTAAELANGIGITIRSARRILNKLEQCDVAFIVGEEQPISKGRPRQVYELKLDG